MTPISKKDDLPKKEEDIIQGEIMVIDSGGKPVRFKLDPIEALRQPAVVLAELVTGAVATFPNLPVIAGRLVQATIKGNLLQQLGRELGKMREEGKIKEDYFASNNGSASLNELLELIDTDVPDNEKFKAIKSIFLAEVSLDTNETDRLIAHNLLKICLQLSSLEILVLKTCHDIVQNHDINYSEIRGFDDWIKVVAEKIGIQVNDLIGTTDNKLVNLSLLTGRGYSDKSGISPNPNFRLTGLGIVLCEFIVKFP